MAIKDRLSGNEAVSAGIRQINPDVMPAFPITPSTEIPQFVSQFVADGKIDTELITVESEHSAMSACIGAEAAGVRAMSATSSCGLAYMWELLYVASSDRLPIVLAVANRALSGPININNDHSDSMGARDSGWIQLYSENAQEAYDNMLMAHRIAEHPDVTLPLMVCFDGFITSHAVENIELMEDEKVKQFIGQYQPKQYLLNPKKALSVGPYGISAHYMELKKQQAEAMEHAVQVISDVSKEFETISGRSYDLIETFYMDDADYAIVVIGSSAGTAKSAIRKLREQGLKCGLIKIRAFRPFPANALAKALRNVKVLGIMDKCEGFSANGGPLGSEIRGILYNDGNLIQTLNYIYGLGGRDFSEEDVFAIFEELKNGFDVSYKYIGIRE